jgi:hypothetical protein
MQTPGIEKIFAMQPWFGAFSRRESGQVAGRHEPGGCTHWTFNRFLGTNCIDEANFPSLALFGSSLLLNKLFRCGFFSEGKLYGGFFG